jgi:hypothetical protein
MKKIKIPRKLKKVAEKCWVDYQFPNVPKLARYIHYLRVEWGIKYFGMSAEELCNTFGKFMKDDVIWWYWVRWKELGIEPTMSKKYQEYWDYFVEKGVIHQKENVTSLVR